MTDDEKRKILATARANVAAPRPYISEADQIEQRMRQREQRTVERAKAKALRRVAQECETAFRAWQGSENDAAAANETTVSWTDWVEKRLEEERALIIDAVGEAIGEFVEQAHLQMRGELLTEMNRLRAEAARERASDLKQLKIRNAELGQTLAKMQREVSSHKIELPRTKDVLRKTTVQ
jgi:hypothetical protein